MELGLRNRLNLPVLALLFGTGLTLLAGPLRASSDSDSSAIPSAQLGPRPYYLIEQMNEGALKRELQACARDRSTFAASNFSIGHRGAPLQFPEHTLESYMAAAQMGAGIIECDVAFTRDRELVCRHSQCDLHTTTDIVATPLAEQCQVPPVVDAQGRLTNAAEIRCCTSDITLTQFKTLQGKPDAADTKATTISDYIDGGLSPEQTALYSGNGRGTLLSHAESIALFDQLEVGMTPELKAPMVPMPFQGEYTQQDYARQMIGEYIAAGIAPARVWPQSFNYDDVLFWIAQTPAFGRQAVYLDNRRVNTADPAAVAALQPSMPQVAADGVRIIAPPMFMLLQDKDGRIAASAYADAAKDAGLNIVSWTTERSGRLAPGGGGYYYSTIRDLINNDGDIYTVMEVLAQDVGIVALFSDWPATTTFYANCRPVNTPPRSGGVLYNAPG